MDTAEMAEIAALIARALRHRDDAVLSEVRADVNLLCGKFPPYSGV
jgi:glycine/serine hydroxymethyltransferase